METINEPVRFTSSRHLLNYYVFVRPTQAVWSGGDCTTETVSSRPRPTTVESRLGPLITLAGVSFVNAVPLTVYDTQSQTQRVHPHRTGREGHGHWTHTFTRAPTVTNVVTDCALWEPVTTETIISADKVRGTKIRWGRDMLVPSFRRNEVQYLYTLCSYDSLLDASTHKPYQVPVASRAFTKASPTDKGRKSTGLTSVCPIESAKSLRESSTPSSGVE